MALYLNGNKIVGGGGGSASDTTFDDTNVSYEADDVQKALEKITKRLTYAEYQALTDAEKNNGTIYLITDVNGDGQSFQPVIYSTEEREIGVWTNGKPLYEKTLKVGTASSTSEQYFETNILSADVDTYFIKESFIITGTGLVWTTGGSNDGFFHILFLAKGTTNLRVSSRVSSNAMYGDLYITIRYTKSTDTAGSGTWTPQGVPAVHYSTEEQIVGTWIDGSTLYEKTIIITNASKDASYDLGITDFDTYFVYGGSFGAGVIPYLHGSYPDNSIGGFFDDTGSSLAWAFRSGSQVPATISGFITVRYTKSST